MQTVKFLHSSIVNDSVCKKALLSYFQIAHVLKKRKHILRNWACDQTLFEDVSQLAAWRKACCGSSRANSVAWQWTLNDCDYCHIDHVFTIAGVDPASKVRGEISVIFGRTSLIRYCERDDEIKCTSHLCCDKTMDDKMSLRREGFPHKIMMEKITFVVFRRKSPQSSLLGPTLHNSLNGNTDIDGRGERNRKRLRSTGPDHLRQQNGSSTSQSFSNSPEAVSLWIVYFAHIQLRCERRCEQNA